MADSVEAAIECRQLGKRYGRLAALDSFDLTVPRGASFGVLGPNGAGKSTLLRLILGFIRPSNGSLSVLGETDVERARPRIGYLPERPHYDSLFTAREYLAGLGRLLGLRGVALDGRVDELIERVGLKDAAGRRLRGYSKGMLQRVGIAQALLGDPDLLLLDEPSAGLDPRGQWEMSQLILQASQEQRTVLVCSHSLAEIQRTCSHACIIRGGRAVWLGEVSPAPALGRRVRIEPARVDGALRFALTGIAGLIWQGTAIIVPETEQSRVLRILLDREVSIRSLNPEQHSLEQTYLLATGNAQIAGGE